MTSVPQEITDALEVLDREQERVASAIAQKRAEHANLYTLPSDTYDELMTLYRKRDQLANSVNNMKAYYDVA